jgi:ADP-ribose pyrophosphatase YjhB (NUDIX family)
MSNKFEAGFIAMVTPKLEVLTIRSTRPNLEIELPGGGAEHNEKKVQDTAFRETFEEAGVDCSAFKPLGAVGFLSRIRQTYTGLLVVRLSSQDHKKINFGFTGPETSSIQLTALEALASMPTYEEDPTASEFTFRGHRVMAAAALGIATNQVPDSSVDFFTPPFESTYLQDRLSAYYETSV